MREILFRGKRVNNEEWETGSLVITRQDTSEKKFFITDKMTGFPTPVIAETVGQFTGLTDHNGTKIFEGDIVNCSRGCPHEVIYEEQHGGMYFGGMPAFYLSGLSNGYAWTGDEEKIGNIHDNPELLGDPHV